MKKEVDLKKKQRQATGRAVGGTALGLVMALKIANYDVDRIQNLRELRRMIDVLTDLHLYLSLNEAYGKEAE